MRICLITGIFPPDIGGPATYVSRLAAALRAQGHAVCVVTQGTTSADDPPDVTRISRAYALPLRLWLIFWTLLKQGRDCQVWYINGLEVPAVLAGKLLRKRLIMKIVGDYAWERAMNQGLTSDRIDAFQHTPQSWKVEWHKRLRAWYTRQVAQVITPSRYLKQLVCGWGVPEERIRVIYNAVEALPDDLESRPDARQQLGLPAERIYLVTVARLVAWKGIDQLIRILRELDEHVHLLVLGDGPEKNRLTEFAVTMNVAHRVVFAGTLTRRQVLRYLRAADVFVLHTAYEGFSHVLLEAMLVGLPVITTAVCGNPELVVPGKNGLLCDYGNTELLTAQIQSIIRDHALAKRLIDEGQHTAQQFSWNRLLDQTQEILIGVHVKKAP